MKPNFALDLSHEGIRLLHRTKGGWSLVGSVALDDPDLARELEELRRSAAMLEAGGFTTKLVIPDSQVLYTTVSAPGPDDIARETQIRAALDGMTPYPVGELVFDWRADGDEARIAVLARETMEEAENFAANYRFNPVSFVARPGRGKFTGEPFFGKTRAAAALLPAGERIDPDASPIPRQTGPADVADNTVAAPTGPAEPAPESADRSARAGDAETEPASKSVAPKRPKSKSRRRKPKAGAGVEAPVLAAFPPPPDDNVVFAPETAAPAPRSGDAPTAKEVSTRSPEPDAEPGVETGPDTAPETGIETRAETLSNETPAPDAETPQPVTFSTRRTEPAASETPEPEAPEPESPAVARPASATPGRVPVDASPVAPPRDPVRAGMAEALSEPLPRPEIPRPPADRMSSRPAPIAARTATASPAGPGTPPEGKGFTRLRRRQELSDDARAREAEALTVFGARKSQAAPPRPRYLGLILTVVLLLVMAAVAIWSGFFVGSSTESSLFNPPTTTGPQAPPDQSGADTSTATATTAEPGATSPADATPPPAADTDTVLPQTAEVLTPQAAEARYAATGIWQRAPEVPVGPEGGRLDNAPIAPIAPAAASHVPAPLPDTGAHGTSDAQKAVPVPPPPPGTTFNFDENGLVVATPEGALSPGGILVYAGRPPVVPPPPPAGLFPEAPVAPASPAETAPAATPAPAPATPSGAAASPEDIAPAAPSNPATTPPPQLAALDIPKVRPRSRPAGLIAPAPDPAESAMIDATIASIAAADAVNASELAVASSVVPSQRPGNFARIVDAAQASASDGSQVIAASATVTPQIPTSANVATRATTRNALNLSRVNLIGIYGSSGARRALVRLANGRYVKVKVGDRLDGGKVTSITATGLTYQKGSRAMSLKVLPLG